MNFFYFLFSDSFAGLTVTIHFQRRTMYYIFQMYLPCVCIVALSWVSFWIDPDAIPARVGLSITTVLTICYMLGSVNSNLPRVSYVKAIDYFLLMSFGFIFLTLVEYVFVLRYSRRMKYVGSFAPGDKTHPDLIEKANWVSFPSFIYSCYYSCLIENPRIQNTIENKPLFSHKHYHTSSY